MIYLISISVQMLYLWFHWD